MTMEEVRVQVPSEHVGAFYKMFGEWRDGLQREASSEAQDPDATMPVGGNEPTYEDLLDAAVRWWSSLKRMEGAVWGAWIDAAPRTVTAEELVRTLGFSSTRDIPGAISWSGRKAKKVGFPLDWQFGHDKDGNAYYGLCATSGMTVEEYAELLREARARVEASN